MHDLRWQRWLDDLVQAYFVSVYRPELPGAERLRAARAVRQGFPFFEQGGEQARLYLRSQLVSADPQRRNGAARVLSEIGDRADADVLIACYLDDGRQWLSPTHLVRIARRHPLGADLAPRIATAPVRIQTALVRALLAAPSAEGIVLFERLVQGPVPVLGEAAAEAVSRWGRPDLLLGVLRRIDGTDACPPALVTSGIVAAAHLALDGDPIALDWLEERTGDSDPFVAGLAHAWLGSLGWPRCVPELADLLRTAWGPALGAALEAAEALATGDLVAPLCDVVLRTVDESGPDLDGSPADQAIRVLERMTGRALPSDLCGYDPHGSLDAATRRRAALLFGSVVGLLEPGTRYRGGRLLTAADRVADLVATSPQRVRVAARQLRAASGVDHGFDCREDLVANAAAVEARQADDPAFPDGEFRWRGRPVDPAPVARVPVANGP